MKTQVENTVGTKKKNLFSIREASQTAEVSELQFTVADFIRDNKTLESIADKHGRHGFVILFDAVDPVTLRIRFKDICLDRIIHSMTTTIETEYQDSVDITSFYREIDEAINYVLN